jgi:hypothetical protein
MSRPKGFKHSESTKRKTSKTLMGHPGSRVLYKGNNATYSAFHRRIYTVFGKANYCSLCGLNDPKRKFYWANLTGKYHDMNDYMSMCQSCHVKFDYQRRLKSGKKTSSI